MWILTTPLREDGEMVVQALTRRWPRDLDSCDAIDVVSVVLLSRSIAGRLLRIPESIVTKAATKSHGKQGLTLACLSRRVAELAMDLAHVSVNSVHILYAISHLAEEDCSRFFRECDREIAQSRTTQLDDDSAALLAQLREVCAEKPKAECGRIGSKRTLSLPFVERALTQYLTSIWYPFDHERSVRYMSLDPLVVRSEEVEAFVAAAGYARGLPLNEGR